MSVTQSLIQASLLGEAVEHGPAAVFVADENGCYVAVNQAACALVGYDREDLLGMCVFDLLATGGEVGRWRAKLGQGGAVSGTATLRRKDASTVDYSYVAGATTVAGMPVYVSVGAPS
jgi:PAS domain S-box-containing protein